MAAAFTAFSFIASHPHWQPLSPGEAEEITLQEDMSKQFQAILEEIDRKQGNIDFSEVLEAIRTTSLGVAGLRNLC